MKRILSMAGLGAVIGGAIAVIMDECKPEEKRNTLKSLVIGAGAGATLCGAATAYIVAKNFQTDIKNQVTKEIYKKVEKEILDKINYADIQDDANKTAEKNIEKTIAAINNKAMSEIDKTIKQINEQNILALDKKTNKRMDNMEAAIKKLQNTPQYILNTDESGTNKYDIMKEIINNPKFTPYQVQTMLETMEDMD